MTPVERDRFDHLVDAIHEMETATALSLNLNPSDEFKAGVAHALRHSMLALNLTREEAVVLLFNAIIRNASMASGVSFLAPRKAKEEAR